MQVTMTKVGLPMSPLRPGDALLRFDRSSRATEFHLCISSHRTAGPVSSTFAAAMTQPEMYTSYVFIRVYLWDGGTETYVDEPVVHFTYTDWTARGYTEHRVP